MTLNLTIYLYFKIQSKYIFYFHFLLISRHKVCIFDEIKKSLEDYIFSNLDLNKF